MYILSVVVLSIITGQNAYAEKLNVTVYYEALCIHSKAFITKQLFPGYLKIGEYLEIDFVPYGNANKTLQDGEWLFKCQHGSEECIGNKYQVCALNQNLSQDQNVRYINCMMAADDPASENDAFVCSEKFKFSWSKMKKCMDTFEGGDLLALYGDRTDAANPKIKFVPTIHFNNRYSDELQFLAQSTFLKAACALYKEKPIPCSNI